MVACIVLVACSDSASNAESCSSPAAQASVVILGDSIFDLAKSSCTHVGHYLEDTTGKRIPDYSVSGATMRATPQAPFWTIPLQFVRAAADAPATVLFDGGINDLRSFCPQSEQPSCTSAVAGIEEDFRELVAVMRADGVRNIVYLEPYHISPTGLYGDLAGSIDAWTDRMARVADELDVILVDPRNAFDAVPGLLAADGLHPSRAGSARLAELIFAALLANGIVP